MKQKRNKKLLGIVFCIMVIVSGPAAAGHLSNNTRIKDNVEKYILLEKEPYSVPLNLDGNTLYVGGSGPGNFSKIQDAIDNATDGDTVFVYDDSSPYIENVIINKSINLIGEKRHSTIIDSGGSGDVVIITANWVNISGFTIQNSGGSDFNAGIYVGSNHSTISGNNIIENNWLGIAVYYCIGNTITSNKIIANRWSGMVLYHSNDNTITSNTIRSNKFGIHLGYSNGNTIKGNIIISNDNEGINIQISNNNTIADNIVSKNEQGINLGGHSKYNTVSGNIVLLNEYGIRIYESNNNTIWDNAIRWNMCGLSLLYSYSTIIKHNNFIRNIFQALFEYYLPGGNFSNCWDGNYWNRPRLLPKPIFGWQYVEPKRFDPYIEFDRSPALRPFRLGE